MTVCSIWVARNSCTHGLSRSEYEVPEFDKVTAWNRNARQNPNVMPAPRVKTVDRFNVSGTLILLATVLAKSANPPGTSTSFKCYYRRYDQLKVE